jgi:hypothetical protein
MKSMKKKIDNDNTIREGGLISSDLQRIETARLYVHLIRFLVVILHVDFIIFSRISE